MEIQHRIVLRADGSSEIGMGHIYRLLALAEMLTPMFQCVFVSHTSFTFLDNALSSLNIPFLKTKYINYSLPDARKREDEIEFDLNEIITSDDIVVLDGYWFGKYYQSQIIKKGCKVVLIDDIYNNHPDVNVVINHSPGAKKEKYKVSDTTKLYLGLDYVLLRSIFLNLAKHCNDSRVSQGNKHICVCFGGSDMKNFTLMAVSSLISYNQGIGKISIVVGAGYKHLSTLQVLNDSRINFYQDLTDIGFAELIKTVDISIVSPSTVVFEMMTTSATIIGIPYADNQLEIFNFLVEKKSIIPLYSFDRNDFNKAFSQAFIPSDNLDVKLIDGLSANRIQHVFNTLIHED
jgi:UDP-2,4-diacetamido-2,4,6-trideoxy-beta-L-altropyranose hydrolase